MTKVGLIIRKTSDGRVQARRLDGQPLTPADRAEARLIAATEVTGIPVNEQTSRKSRQLTAQELIDVDHGKISAVLMDTAFGPLWFAFNDNFQPGDDIPVFFASELPWLRKMTTEELRRRYAMKKTIEGGWIRNRIEH